MNETHVQDYLAGEASRVAVGLPPMGTIVEDGRRGRRRRGWLTGGVTAAVVAFAAVGGTVLAGELQPDGTPLPPATSAAADPVAEGQWVGFDQIGVDVPAGWDTTMANCEPGLAMQRMVGSDSDGDGDSDSGAIAGPCDVSAQAGAVSIAFQRITAEELEQISGRGPSAAPVRDVDGVEVRVGALNCVEGALEWCVAGIHVPDRDLNITVMGYDARERVESLVASVRVVPSLPELPAAEALPVDDTTTHWLGVADVSVEVQGPWTFTNGTCGEPLVGRDVSLDEVSAGATVPCTWSWTDGTSSLMIMDGAGTAERRQRFASDLGGYAQQGSVDGLAYGYDEPNCAAHPIQGGEGERNVCSWQAFVGERGLTITMTGVPDEQVAQQALDSLRIVPADERS